MKIFPFISGEGNCFLKLLHRQAVNPLFGEKYQ